MRISNIKQYLGGADNVIARDIIEQDQFRFNFKIGTETLTNYTFEVDTQLFKAEVTTKGSNITIDTLTPQQTTSSGFTTDESGSITIVDGGATTASARTLSTIGISLSTLIVPNGFELKVTKDDGTELTRGTNDTFPSDLTTYTLRLSNGLLQLLHRSQVVGGDVLTVTYKRIKDTATFTYPSSVTIDTSDSKSANLLIPSTLLSDLTFEHSPVDSTNPYIVVMSVTTDDNGTPAIKRTFRLLWILRYRPMSS